MKLNIAPPWYIFRNQLNALFQRDPDIIVGDVYENEEGDIPYGIDIEVLDHEKFVALDRVLPKVRQFGNVKLAISVFDEENDCYADISTSLFETIFRDNPALQEIKEAEDLTGTKHGFVLFKPEVLQFYADDLSSYDGSVSCLAQDIAREVFDNVRGIHFCTAPVDGAEA